MYVSHMPIKFCSKYTLACSLGLLGFFLHENIILWNWRIALIYESILNKRIFFSENYLPIRYYSSSDQWSRNANNQCYISIQFSETQSFWCPYCDVLQRQVQRTHTSERRTALWSSVTSVKELHRRVTPILPWTLLPLSSVLLSSSGKCTDLRMLFLFLFIVVYSNYIVSLLVWFYCGLKCGVFLQPK